VCVPLPLLYTTYSSPTHPLIHLASCCVHVVSPAVVSGGDVRGAAVEARSPLCEASAAPRGPSWGPPRGPPSAARGPPARGQAARGAGAAEAALNDRGAASGGSGKSCTKRRIEKNEWTRKIFLLVLKWGAAPFPAVFSQLAGPFGK